MTHTPTGHRPLRDAFALALVLLALATAARAHQWTVTEAVASFTPDSRFQVDFVFDYDAVLADMPPGNMTNDVYEWMMEHTTPEARDKMMEDIKASLQRNVRLNFDGAPAPFEVAFPELHDPPPDWIRPGGPWPGHIARLTGAIPQGAREFTLNAAKIYGPVFLKFAEPNLTREALAEVPLFEAVAPTTDSTPFHLDSAAPQELSTAQAAWQYLVLGYEHILPKGLDHILFVLGLFLLAAGVRPLLIQVTAFTLAHSLTLALSIYGVVSLPSRVVEPLIAISIAFIAVENILTTKLKPWRPAVVFAFGLLHGLGFAGVLTELGLPRSQFVTALVTFNLGVELGQLSVILLAFAALGWLRKRPWYRARVTIPASCAIALVALYWTIQRIFFA